MSARRVIRFFFKSFPAWPQPRWLLFLLIFSTRFESYSQHGNDWRTNIDILVERSDSLSLRSQKTFHLSRILRNDKSFRNDDVINETWHYTLNQGKVIIFQIRYVVDSSEFTESYYLNNGRVICMEQYESEYYSYDDNIIWGKVFFFVNNTLKLHVTVGKNKKGDRNSDPQYDSLQLFAKRYSQLQENLNH